MKKSVKVMGRNVPVKQKNNVYVDNGQGPMKVFGYYDPDKLEIVLEKNQSHKSAIRTLRHETMHALFDRAGIRCTGLSQDLQEILCEILACYIEENFRDK